MRKSSIAVDLNFFCGWLNPSFLALTGLHEPVNQQMQNQCKDIIFLIKTLSQRNSVLFNTILLAVCPSFCSRLFTSHFGGLLKM